ncbi:MAG: HAD family hydrolase [Cyanobacteriota bacterium]|jgi:3-deoxy-D-manno-octulosonate 8-phosphate phosphatase (KDO 8-P phosphatase)|nr:HAD family hydrolase [Cyanobacteriota bacterium]
MLRTLHRRWRHHRAYRRCRIQLRQLRLLVLDVDGVLTDGGLWTTETGEVFKRFDVRDGLGIRLLQQAGLEVAWLSGGKSGATEQRARYLGISHVLTGVRDKPAALAALQAQLGVSRAESAFVGDDLNDLAVRPAIGLLVCTADAVAPLRQRADWVLDRNGGDGAVRRLAEEILRARGEWDHLARQGWRDRND